MEIWLTLYSFALYWHIKAIVQLSKSRRTFLAYQIHHICTMIDCNVDGLLLKVKHAKIPFPYSFFFSPINYDFDIRSEIQFSTGFFFAHFFYFISIEYSATLLLHFPVLPSTTQRCISKKKKKDWRILCFFFLYRSKKIWVFFASKWLYFSAKIQSFLKLRFSAKKSWTFVQ